MFSGFARRWTFREGSGSKTFPTGRLLTDHGAVDDVELVAAQQGLAAQLLQLLVAAVVGQAAPGGQTRGGRGFTGGGPWRGAGSAGGPWCKGLTCLLPPRQEGAEDKEIN